MSMHKGLISSAGRAVALTAIAALILTTLETPLTAAPASRTSQGMAMTTASGNATDFSSRHRYRHRHYRGGGAAGAAFMGLAIGAITGAIAAQQRRDEYEYYSGQGYYYPPRNYYGGGYYYQRPHYYHPHYYRPY